MFKESHRPTPFDQIGQKNPHLKEYLSQKSHRRHPSYTESALVAYGLLDEMGLNRDNIPHEIIRLYDQYKTHLKMFDKEDDNFFMMQEFRYIVSEELPKFSNELQERIKISPQTKSLYNLKQLGALDVVIPTIFCEKTWEMSAPFMITPWQFSFMDGEMLSQRIRNDFHRFSTINNSVNALHENEQRTVRNHIASITILKDKSTVNSDEYGALFYGAFIGNELLQRKYGGLPPINQDVFFKIGSLSPSTFKDRRTIIAKAVEVDVLLQKEQPHLDTDVFMHLLHNDGNIEPYFLLGLHHMLSPYMKAARAVESLLLPLSSSKMKYNQL